MIAEESRFVQSFFLIIINYFAYYIIIILKVFFNQINHFKAIIMNEEIYEKLVSLIQLDTDAVNAYEQAIEKTDDLTIRSHLENYKDDHQRHIDELSDYISANGMDVPEQKADIKGLFIEGFTALRSSTGTNGVLKAMEGNEKLTNKKYDEATLWDLDETAEAIVRRAYNDEKIHLAYIQDELFARTK